MRQGHEAAHVGPQPLDGRHQAQDVLQLLVALGAARAVRLGGVERDRARGGAGAWDVGEILRDVGEVHVAAQLAVAAAVAVELQLRLRQDHAKSWSSSWSCTLVAINSHPKPNAP